MKTLQTILISIFIMSASVLYAQTKSTYTVGGTKYNYNETYKTTGLPKVERSSTSRKEFLNSRGYDKVPSGYQVDHIVPLHKGGADRPYNMQIISNEQHKAKTAAERSSTSIPKYTTPTTTYKSYNTPPYNSSPSYKSSPSYNSSSSYKTTPSYNSSSSYKSVPSYNSTPSYNSGGSKTIHTGSRGGQYYYNSSGNKTYIKRK